MPFFAHFCFVTNSHPQFQDSVTIYDCVTIYAGVMIYDRVMLYDVTNYGYDLKLLKCNVIFSRWPQTEGIKYRKVGNILAIRSH
jgi:hypothetical protein